MSWIESHQELGRHPKTCRMAKQLGISRPAVIGHLHYLWWWAMDFAQDGNVTGFDNDELAEAALWDGNSVDFFQALACSGFIDVLQEAGQDEKCVLHDWSQYAGKLAAHRKANAEKQKTWRDKQKDTVTETEDESNGYVAVTLPLRYGATGENRTEEKRKKDSEPPAAVAALPLEIPLVKKALPKRPFDLDGFHRFYNAYPKHVAKTEALQAWNRLAASSQLQETILAFIESMRRSEAWQEDGGKYVPNPATFLNKKRWEDEMMPSPAYAQAPASVRLYSPANDPKFRQSAAA